MEGIYEDKKKEYGESWKTMELWQLRDRLQEELKEYQEADNLIEEYFELIDVINVALMLATRMGQRLTGIKKASKRNKDRKRNAG